MKFKPDEYKQNVPNGKSGISPANLLGFFILNYFDNLTKFIDLTNRDKEEYNGSTLRLPSQK